MLNTYKIKSKKYDNILYSGQQLDKKANGIGKQTHIENSGKKEHQYIGQFENDCRNGFGKYSFSEGNYDIGFNLYDTGHGFGIKIIENKIEQFGLYRNNDLSIDIAKDIDDELLNEIRIIFEQTQNQIDQYYSTVKDIKQYFDDEDKQLEYLQSEQENIDINIQILEEELEEMFPSQFHLFNHDQQVDMIKIKDKQDEKHKYKGQLKGLTPFGIGQYTSMDGISYIGWFKCLREGFGTVYFSDGSKCIGFQKDDDFHGCTFFLNKDDQVESFYDIHKSSYDNWADILTKNQQQQLLQMFKDYQQSIEDNLNNINSKLVNVCDIKDNKTQHRKEIQKLQKELDKLCAVKFRNVISKKIFSFLVDRNNNFKSLLQTQFVEYLRVANIAQHTQSDQAGTSSEQLKQIKTSLQRLINDDNETNS